MSYPQIVHQRTKDDVKAAIEKAQEALDTDPQGSMSLDALREVFEILKRVDEDLNY